MEPNISNTQPPSPNPLTPINPIDPQPPRRKKAKKWWAIGGGIIAVLAIAAGAYWWGSGQCPAQSSVMSTQNTSSSQQKTPVASSNLTLDESKNYGNKYANGLLPVGDSHYVTDAPKTGYVYACSQYAQNLTQGGGGAQARGPWFTNNNTEYDINKKIHVNGAVTWTPQFTNTLSQDSRIITTNDLPSHTTGIFPIAASDPASQYDRNPNTITAQSLTFTLAAAPTYDTTAHCMGGTAGVMLTGVELNNGFDAGGRDAGAWEIQDACAGHPQNRGVYHYHTLSTCITDISVHTVIGYALDGFPITGPQVNGGSNVLTTSDLDECHGITSGYQVNGKTITGYHYVMTQDFPYSVSCFRATPIQAPGMQEALHQ
ncbi:MAG TPA: YHYH protein [Dongiaceae bacterium]|nr:YHYH protein [Dongiaceae bacterium]